MPAHLTLPVLMYHSISDVRAGPHRDLAVPARRLSEQLTALHDAGYALVGLTEALTLTRRHPGALVVALTFDDGFRDFLTEALEVLADVGASATLYQAVEHIGGLASWLGNSATDFPRLLDWDELAEVEAAGVEIGSHALVHHPLDVLPPGQVQREIGEAKARLEQYLRKPIDSFAYPHGYSSRSVRQAVDAAGHDSACGVGRRRHLLGGDPLAIPRLPVTPGCSGTALVELVRTGDPRLAPLMRDAARPGWRLTRRLVVHVFGRTLT